MARYGMVVDLKRCVGCDTCTMACKAERATPRGMLWQSVVKYETGKYPHSKLNALPVTCMQCKEPDCVKVCPTGASQKRPDGIVIVDSGKCMGCGYCVLSCPYGARHFLDKVYNYYEGHETRFERIGFGKHTAGTVEKCDYCLDRVKEGLEPACVAACIANARFFGDLDDPASEVSKLMEREEAFVISPDMGTEPSCHYLPAERGGEA
jgi:Fe-S-cluster-containing dehydrogenase component